MKNAKRALSLVLVLALALSMCVIGAGAVVFSDVPSTYAYSSEIQFLADLEIVTGYTDGTFQPEGIVTRAEAAAVIFRTLAGKESASENYQGATVFSDVSAEHWACGYVNFCTEMGIINGYPDGTFRPDQTITYAEYVTMLARALGLDIGKDLSYPYGYIAEATVEGINYGVDLAATADCPRGATAKLTYNAIFDATYRRIANNIYTTEKPTIAENVLKLTEVEGTVTSVDKYDWAGDNAVGEGNFRVIDMDNDNEVYEFDYDLDTSYLGKDVKVWYKPYVITASGDKVYAVVEQENTSATLPHIVLKGAVNNKETELTYALNDVDYKAKLADDCIFVENNEYIGDIEDNFGTQLDATTFYPTSWRMWLPISYTFLDNDADGKYDFVVRKIYAAREVTSLTANKIGLDGLKTVDRKDDSNVAYAWNDGLADVEEEDWVLFYCDGAVTPDTRSIMTATPDFESDLYDDTGYAEFSKLSSASLPIESIVDHDIYVFDGVTYRLSTYEQYIGGNVSDISTENAIGDEFDLWYTPSFGGIIFSASDADNSTGKWLVVLDADDDTSAFASKNFDINAVTEDGSTDTWTVKATTSDKLVVYDVDGTKLDKDSLTCENLNDLLDENEYLLCQYKTNAKDQITELDVYLTADTIDVADADDVKDYYNNGTVYADNDTYNIESNSLVFVVYEDTDKDPKVFTGSFPKIVSDDDAYIFGAKVKTVSGMESVKAMAIYVDGNTTGASDSENIAGYLRKVSRVSTDDGYVYEYTIAYGDNEAAVIRSDVGEDSDDLDEIVVDDTLIDNATWSANKANVILFDIKADGTIENMRYVDDEYDYGDIIAGCDDLDTDNQYYASFVVTAVNSSSKKITVAPIIEGATNSAKVYGAYGDEDAPVIYDAAEAKTYTVASDANVFEFDMDSTNTAKVTIEGLGAIQKLNAGEGSIISFGYDDDDRVITSIFLNSEEYFAEAD